MLLMKTALCSQRCCSDSITLLSSTRGYGKRKFGQFSCAHACEARTTACELNPYCEGYVLGYFLVLRRQCLHNFLRAWVRQQDSVADETLGFTSSRREHIDNEKAASSHGKPSRALAARLMMDPMALRNGMTWNANTVNLFLDLLRDHCIAALSFC